MQVCLNTLHRGILQQILLNTELGGSLLNKNERKIKIPMPNKDSLVIQPSDEIISHTALQSDVIVFDEEKRQKVIQVLRQIPAILDVAKKLSEGKTYQAYFPPEIWERIKDGSARLDNKDDGLFGVLIRDVETGHITITLV